VADLDSATLSEVLHGDRGGAEMVRDVSQGVHTNSGVEADHLRIGGIEGEEEDVAVVCSVAADFTRESWGAEHVDEGSVYQGVVQPSQNAVDEVGITELERVGNGRTGNVNSGEVLVPVDGAVLRNGEREVEVEGRTSGTRVGEVDGTGSIEVDVFREIRHAVDVVEVAEREELVEHGEVSAVDKLAEGARFEPDSEGHVGAVGDVAEVGEVEIDGELDVVGVERVAAVGEVEDDWAVSHHGHHPNGAIFAQGSEVNKTVGISLADLNGEPIGEVEHLNN